LRRRAFIQGRSAQPRDKRRSPEQHVRTPAIGLQSVIQV
jgi:hypothetical protein